MDGPTTSSVGDYVAIARRRRTLLLTFCPSVLLLAVLLAFKLPAVYRSSGTILLETPSVPEDLIRSTVVPAYADQQVELLRRRVMTPERLSALVEETDPYPERLRSRRAGQGTVDHRGHRDRAGRPDYARAAARIDRVLDSLSQPVS